MEKETFLTLLKNYTSLTQAEVFELISIQSKYPYSQAIHNLCSRAALDLKLDAREQLLHTSAIYATERSVLKGIMSAPKEERIVPEIAIAEVSVEPHESVPVLDAGIPEPKISVIEEPELKGDELIQDLMKEIDKLRVSQEKFETTVREFDKINSGASESELKKK